MGGITFSIGHSRSKKLNHLNSETCEGSFNKTKKHIKNVIEKLKDINDFKNTDDYKKYELFPGQQLRRSVKGIFPHTAIYLYDGYIVEMGSSTRKCSRNLGNPLKITEHITGITTLRNFNHYSKNNTYKIITPLDENKKEIMKRLKRAAGTVGKNKYNFFTDNCINAANYISYGNKSLINTNNIVRKKI